MAGNFYLGNVSDLASNMGSMFGGGTVSGVSSNPSQWKAPLGGGSVEGPPPTIQAPKPVTGSVPPNQQQSLTASYNPLAAQAVRPTSFGNMDPSYGQNLASSIGSAFQRPNTPNTPLQFNPYGNLTDANVQYPNLGGGNAPLPGLPQTLLQWAQMFSPSTLSPSGPGVGV